MSGEMTTIARPYAEAAYAYAKENNEVPAWSTALAQLAMITSDPQISTQLANPALMGKQIGNLILAVAGENIPPAVNNLIWLLAQNRRLNSLGELARLFEARRIAEQGVRHILIRSAFDISLQEQKTLIDALTRRFGWQIELRIETDQALIGGVEIRAEDLDLVIDGSVRGKLQKLAQTLQI